MPIQESKLHKIDDGERVLDNGKILSHYAHVKAGKPRDTRCQFCRKGVDAVLTKYEEPAPESDVVQGDRSDKEGDAAPARDNQRDWFDEEG